MHRFIGIVVLLLLHTATEAETLKFQSGIQQTQMIELYTSEGCSSCPPAEAFLNSYADETELWSRYIPLAFHVDYWDYLGWKDPYADRANSRRQYLYAQLKKVSTVYTPGFIVNGKEWRGWRYQGIKPVVTRQVGNLQVSIEGDILKAAFDSLVKFEGPLYLNYVILGMGLETEIKAGENRGHRSRHDFVVLLHRRIASRGAEWQAALERVDTAARRQALVVWIEQAGDPAPLQAAGSYLDR